MKFMNEHTSLSLDMDYVFSRISPKTPYGMQKKRGMKPYKAEEITLLLKEYEETENLMGFIRDHPLEHREILGILSGFKEIRQSIKRSVEGSILDEVELFEIKNFLFSIRDLLYIEEKTSFMTKEYFLNRLYELEEMLDPDKEESPTFYLYDSYSPELNNIRRAIRELQRKFELERRNIINYIEEFIGSKLKLSGEIAILKNDIERLNRARGCPYLSEESGTILQVTFKLKNNNTLNELLNDIDNIRQLENEEEYRIKVQLSKSISKNSEGIFDLTEKLGALDFLMARAEFAVSIGGIKPILHCHGKIIIENGRYLKLEEVLKKRGRGFCPISLTSDMGVTIITGANMGGKTINLKLVGMLTAMAQYGLYVPAEKFETCLFDYIYFSIGDMQSIDSGLSTFGSEIAGMIDILERQCYRGLVLIDELARGTNPEEGYALSRALVRYLKNSNSITLFTTHFDGITLEEGVKHLRVRGLKALDFNAMSLSGGENTSGVDLILKNMDYSLEEVVSSHEVPRDAINIAKLMGLDENIIKLAEQIMEKGREDNNGKT